TLIESGKGGELAILEYNDNTKKVVENKGNVALADIDEKDIIERFDIDGSEHTLTGRFSVGEDHEYILWEVSAPKGYYTADPIVFYLDASGNIQVKNNTNDPHMLGLGTTTLTMLDRPIEYKISKILTGTGESVRYVKGATLNIYQDLGENVSGPARYVHIYTIEHTSGAEDVIPAGKLEAGSRYVITEKEVPEGFIVSGSQGKVNNEPVIGSFTVALFDSGIQLVNNGVTNILDQGTKVEDDFLKVVISKKTLHGAGDGELVGAELKIVDNTEADKNILYDGLETITTDGKAIWLVDTEKLDLSDGVLDQVTKLAEAAGVRIVGARLKKGHSYTITEVKAPDGYAKTSAGFSIDGDGVVSTDGKTAVRVDVVDPELEVAFDKIALDLDDSSESRLAGAALQLKHGEEVVASWTSGDLPVIITEAQADENGLITVGAEQYRKLGTAEGDVVKEGFKLIAGETYVLHEEKAPEKYHIAKDMEFELKEGDVRKDLRIIRMTDYAEGETFLEVRKKWIVPEDENDFEYPDEIYLDVKQGVTGGESRPYGTYTILKDKLKECAKSGEPILSLTGLEKYNDDGKQYIYSVTERFTEGYNGYTATQGTATNDGVVELINTLNSWPDTEVLVTKRWELYRMFDGKLNTAPVEDITLYLRRAEGERDPENDVIVATETIAKNEYDDFAEYGFKFTEITEGDDKGKPLPKYNTTTGKKYDYYVTENSSDKFTVEVTEPKRGNLYEVVVTNTPDHSQIDIVGEKVWSKVPASEEVRLPNLRIDLYRDGKPIQSVYTGKEENWKFEFKNLDRFTAEYDENGEYSAKLHEYSLKEFNADTGREISEEGIFNVDIPDIRNVTALEPSTVEVTITNTWNNEYVNIGGNKSWPGRFIDSDGTEKDITSDIRKRPPVFIDLYRAETGADGKPVKDADGQLKLTAVKDAGGESLSTTINYYQSSYMFKDLPKYDMTGDAAVPITYVVKERSVEGYRSSPADGYVVVYTADGVAYRPVSSIDDAAAVSSADFASADFTNTPNRVRISKLDASNNAELPGATLRLIRVKTGEVVDTWVSTTSSHYVEALTAGEEYRLEEVSVPDGYFAADPVTFTMNNDGTTQLVTMIDDPIIGEVRLEKRDEVDRTPLSGAEFELFRLNGSRVYVIPVDYVNGVYAYSATAGYGTATRLLAPAGGLTVTGLPYGTYYFNEVRAPKGYELNTRPEIFSVTEATASRPGVAAASRDYRYSTVTFLDRKKTGSVELYKASGDSGNFEASLAGAVFGLYSATPRRTSAAIASSIYADAYYEYGRYVTDGYGRIRVDGLPWDRYYFIELEAPEGYVTNVDVDGRPLVYTFEVNADTVDYAPVQVVNGGYSILDYREGITPPPLPPVTRVPIVPPPTPIVLGERMTPVPATTVTPVPAGTTTPATPATPVPTQAGVLGERRVKNESPIQGVLGVRSAPEQGVLGERVGPATGDAANIALWLIILLASIGAIIAVFVQSSKRKKAK
nr:Cna B-type domain-containing protein [Lachnospiraceae bacterium]